MILSPLTVLALYAPDAQTLFLSYIGLFNILFLDHAISFYACLLHHVYSLVLHLLMLTCIHSFIDSSIPHLLSVYYLPGPDDTKLTDMISALKMLKFKYGIQHPGFLTSSHITCIL